MTAPSPHRLLPLSAALLALLGANACRHAGAAGAPPPPAPPAVVTATVESALPQFHTNLPGELRAYQEVDVQARVEGFVKDVLVDRGSAVRAGQLLAVMEAPDLVARRAAAEQRFSAAGAQRQQAQAALQRDQGTLQRLEGAAAAMPGAVAGNDLSIAQQNVAADRADVAARAAAESASERDLKAVEAVEGYLRVTAPFSGEIVRRSASPGMLAGPTKAPLFQLQQLDPLRLVVDVPETEVAGIVQGMQLTFTVTSEPADQFSATVARISQSVRPTTRTMPVELDAPNPQHRLAPGMYARVAWENQRAYATLFVPSSAILSTTQATYVQRVRDAKVEWVPVRQGFTLDDKTEVFGDLKAGDQVVRQASEELKSGAPVRP